MKKTNVLIECALTVALAVVCSFIKVWEMPQGGSVSLTMVPILIIAFRRGGFCGMSAGCIYGAMSLLLSGVIYHPMSIVLDYLLAFALVGVAGFFKKNLPGIIIGTFTGVFGRFLSSLVSGAVLFGSYAPKGQNPWIYSLIYQTTYLVPELIISVALLVFLHYKSKRLFQTK